MVIQILRGIVDWCNNEAERKDINVKYVQALLKLAEACVEVMKFH